MAISAAPASADCGYVNKALNDPWCGKSNSHREAPSILKDQTADNTDLYAFSGPDA
jgi:hypothetical protein